MFRRYFAGQAISQVGDFVFFVALPWQVFVLTGSAADLGGVFSTYFAAQLILLVAGGVLTDRVSRRTLVVLSDVLQGILVGVVALLAGTGTLAIGHLYVFGALFGAAQAFAMPALSAFLPETVPPGELQAANSVYQGARTLAFIGGPALGALLIAVGGTTAAFAFDAASFAVSATLLWSARGGPSTPRPRERKPSAIVQVREGWRYVARVPWLWITILLFAIVNAAEAGPRGVVLPAFVALDLGGGPTAIGLVLSAMATGSLLGFFLPNFVPTIHRRGLVAYVGTAIFGLSTALFAFSPNLIGILALSFVHGVAVAVFSLMWQTAMMEQVREDIRGRVFSLDELGSFVLLPFSFFACGILAVLFGPRLVLLAGGLIVMLCAAAGLLYPPAHTFEKPRGSS
jgi:DHA3 family tetracycline resistance protein-like MFS transporter